MEGLHPPPPRYCAALSQQYSVASIAKLRVLSCLHSPEHHCSCCNVEQLCSVLEACNLVTTTIVVIIMFVYQCSVIIDSILDCETPALVGHSLLYTELNSINGWMKYWSALFCATLRESVEDGKWRTFRNWYSGWTEAAVEPLLLGAAIYLKAQSSWQIVVKQVTRIQPADHEDVSTWRHKLFLPAMWKPAAYTNMMFWFIERKELKTIPPD
jgi:hypothetical protein